MAPYDHATGSQSGKPEYLGDQIIVDESIRRVFRPADTKLRHWAGDTADRVAKDTERQLRKAKPRGNKENIGIASRARSKAQNRRVDGIDDSLLAVCIDEMRSWARTKDEFKGSEKRMRSAIKSFILYVAHYVKQSLSASDSISAEAKEGCHLFVPSLSADSKSEIADGCDQIDMGLIDRKSTADIEACTNPSYYRLWAIIEARLAKTSKDACGAFAQLCRHTQQMFTEQYDLRFTFGFTVCAGEVCLYHFGNNKIMASAPMDIATREGRRSFIELLINLSLCEIPQLGRDPTIQFMADLNCWQIDCPDGDNNNGVSRDTVKQYYFSTTICHADCLLGRHTRCYQLTDICPTKKRKDGESLEATMVVKDAFAFAKSNVSEDGRDEVRILKRIWQKLESDKSGIMYPKIVVGGRVQFKRGNKTIEDTTSTMYEGVDNELLEKVSGGALFCTHRCFVLESIGKPLHTVETVKKFVTVIGDVMECHHAIVERCQILHQDISDSNILVVQSNSAVRGLLIDFDFAIYVSEDKEAGCGKMAGTLPFMSFNNIISSNVKRTSLDDCESMLFLLCWYATIGFGSDGEQNEAKAVSKRKVIARWRDGDMVSIAKAKLLHLRYLGNFELDIVGDFDRAAKNSKQFAQLAPDLYKALFAINNLGAEYCRTRGAEDDPYVEAFLNRQPWPVDDGDNCPHTANPFELCSQKWEAISRGFLDVLARAKENMVNWVEV